MHYKINIEIELCSILYYEQYVTGVTHQSIRIDNTPHYTPTRTRVRRPRGARQTVGADAQGYGPVWHGRRTEELLHLELAQLSGNAQTDQY